MPAELGDYGKALASDVAVITAASPNEENLRAEIEKELERACVALGIPWTAYQS